MRQPNPPAPATGQGTEFFAALTEWELALLPSSFFGDTQTVDDEDTKPTPVSRVITICEIGEVE